MSIRHKRILPRERRPSRSGSLILFRSVSKQGVGVPVADRRFPLCSMYSICVSSVCVRNGAATKIDAFRSIGTNINTEYVDRFKIVVFVIEAYLSVVSAPVVRRKKNRDGSTQRELEFIDTSSDRTSGESNGTHRSDVRCVFRTCRCER